MDPRTASEFREATKLIDDILLNPEKALEQLQQAWQTKRPDEQGVRVKTAVGTMRPRRNDTPMPNISSANSTPTTKKKRVTASDRVNNVQNRKITFEDLVRERMENDLVATHPRFGITEEACEEIRAVADDIWAVMEEEEMLYRAIEAEFEAGLQKNEANLEVQRRDMNERHHQEIMQTVHELERLWNAGLGREKSTQAAKRSGNFSERPSLTPIQDNAPENWPPDASGVANANADAIDDKRLLALYLRQIQRIHALYRRQAWERTELLRLAAAEVDTLFLTRETAMKKLLAETHSRLTLLRHSHEDNFFSDRNSPSSPNKKRGTNDASFDPSRDLPVGMGGGGAGAGVALAIGGGGGSGGGGSGGGSGGGGGNNGNSVNNGNNNTVDDTVHSVRSVSRPGFSRPTTVFVEDNDSAVATEVLGLKKLAKQFGLLLRRVRKEQESLSNDKEQLSTHLEEQTNLTRSMLETLTELQPAEGHASSDDPADTVASIQEVNQSKKKCLELSRENMQLLSKKNSLLRSINNQTRQLGQLRDQLLKMDLYE